LSPGHYRHWPNTLQPACSTVIARAFSEVVDFNQHLAISTTNTPHGSDIPQAASRLHGLAWCLLSSSALAALNEHA
jgi:hypothetical protein